MSIRRVAPAYGLPNFHGHVGAARLCHPNAVCRFQIGGRTADRRVIHIPCCHTRALPHPVDMHCHIVYRGLRWNWTYLWCGTRGSIWGARFIERAERGEPGCLPNGRVQARCEAQRSDVSCKAVLGTLALDLQLLHIVMNCINCIGDTVFGPYSRTNLGRLGLHVWVVESACDDTP